MNPALSFLVGVLLAYLSGSIPFAWIIARQFAGVDLRKVGSGNIGATNLGRVMGFRWFLVVFLLDLLKGLLPVLLLPLWLMPGESGWSGHFAVLLGLMAVAGHSWPVWLGFRGGKGVATGLGTVIVLGPQASLVAGLVFLSVLGLTRMVSLGSILAALAFAGVQIWNLFPSPFSAANVSMTLFAIVVPALIIFSHRDNIRRIWQGKEHRIGSSSLNKP